MADALYDMSNTSFFSLPSEQFTEISLSDTSSDDTSSVSEAEYLFAREIDCACFCCRPRTPPPLCLYQVVIMEPDILSNIAQHLSNADLLNLSCCSWSMKAQLELIMDRRFVVHRMLNLRNYRHSRRCGPVKSLHFSHKIVAHLPEYMVFIKLCRKSEDLSVACVGKGTGIRLEGLLRAGDLLCFQDPDYDVCRMFKVHIAENGAATLKSAGDVKHNTSGKVPAKPTMV